MAQHQVDVVVLGMGQGGEVLSMLTLAVHERIPIRGLTAMIYAYPTFHRTVEDALHQLG